MAGLLAASALAESFERVTVVERDVLPPIGEGRRAVPQGRHAHALLASGQRSMESLLPGITAELVAAGAQTCRSMSEVRMIIGGHPITKEAVGADLLLASRPLIEGHVRRRVQSLDHVSVREGCSVVDLLTSPSRERVTGVRLRDAGGLEEPLHADLVVAATGRDARVPAALRALGYRSPQEEALGVDIRYVSRRIRLLPGAMGPDKVVLIGARPGLPRAVFLLEQEDHWILTASGYGAAHRPPIDEDGYLAFLATVCPPDVVAAIRTAEPLTALVTHSFPSSLRRRYERLRRFPEGLLVMGDAICSFNPVYAQGMSVAALEALVLRTCVAHGGRGLARRFFRHAGRVIKPAWDGAVGGDLALPEVTGDRSLTVRITTAYTERVLEAAEHDPVVASTFGDVNDLLAPVQDLLRPTFVWRVLRDPLKRPPGFDPHARRAATARTNRAESARSEVGHAGDA